MKTTARDRAFSYRAPHYLFIYLFLIACSQWRQYEGEILWLPPTKWLRHITFCNSQTFSKMSRLPHRDKEIWCVLTVRTTIKQQHHVKMTKCGTNVICPLLSSSKKQFAIFDRTFFRGNIKTEELTLLIQMKMNLISIEKCRKLNTKAMS